MLLHRIVKEDGAAGLFTGAGPTVVRAMALNMGMLASNDQVRRAAPSRRVTARPGRALVQGWKEGMHESRWLLYRVSSQVGRHRARGLSRVL
jgi:Mitochondrial carrier protein